MLRDNLKDTVQTVDGEDVLFYEFEAYTAAFERDPFDDAKDAPGAAFSLDKTQNTILVSGDELDFSARGLDWQGGSQVQRGMINPWYSYSNEDEPIQSIDEISGNKKYIKGIKASLTRPFVTGEQGLLNSNIELLN